MTRYYRAGSLVGNLRQTRWGSTLLGNRITILAYHSISDEYQDELSISPRMFSEQMDWLYSHSIQVVSLETALEKLVNKSDLRRCLVITFDDGYADVMENAIPILDKYKFPATIFMVTGKIGQKSDWHHFSPSRYLLSLADLRELFRRGYSIGSHSHSHADLPSLSSSELEHELLSSRKFLEYELGIINFLFSYPYGNFGEREVQALIKSEYLCACASGGLGNVGYKTDFFRLDRPEIHRRHTMKQFAVIAGSKVKWPLICPALLKSIRQSIG